MVELPRGEHDHNKPRLHRHAHYHAVHQSAVKLWWSAAALLIPLVAIPVALHLFLSDLSEKDFDEVKLAKFMFAVVVASAVLMIITTMFLLEMK